MACSDSRNTPHEKVVFQPGERWRVEDFEIGTYPTLFPFEKNPVVHSLEQDMLEWKIVDDKDIVVEGPEGKIVFQYALSADTLILTHAEQGRVPLGVIAHADDSLTLRFIAPWQGKVKMRRVFPGQIKT